MNEKSLRLLEYDKILNALADFSEFSLGKSLCLSLKPIASLDEVAELQRETSEAREILKIYGPLPFGGVEDVRALAKRSGIGSVLSAGDLLAVRYLLRGARRIRQHILAAEGGYERIKRIAGRIWVSEELERLIDRCIGDEGEVLDSASDRLASIRNQKRTFENRIREKMESYIKSPSYMKYLQDPIITMRNDRYVIPVKNEYRSFIPGIIHDQSSSGATLFIEPLAVVEMNNKLKQLDREEKDEIDRILEYLSREVGAFSDEIEADVVLLGRIDLIFARAAYSIKVGGVEPILNDSGEIDIKNARHPLLTGKVVPISPKLGREFRTLVITGPNTGGKTVTLKTVGLLTLMAQSGLHIPADEGSRISIFRNVFSDIGDEQSIEQNLSTFSSHMTNIIEILKAVDERSLVLLDELGAGTDPTEGASLAMAILEYIHAKGARTIATTHYSELKVFAYNTEGVENASVEFDVDTLQPTYRLLIGLPGRSNAFSISKRLGMPEEIIERAMKRIADTDLKVDAMIENIQQNMLASDRSRREAEAQKREISALKSSYEARIKSLEEEKEKLIAQAKKRADDLLYRAKAEVEEILRELRERRNEQLSTAQISELTRNVRERLSGLSLDSEDGRIPADPVKKVDPKELKPGERIYIPKFKQHGFILEIPEGGDEVAVQVGIMKMNIRIDDIAKESSGGEEPTARGKAKSLGLEKAKSLSSELDLRGMKVEEAIAEVEKYLDDASLASVPSIRIIHGKGTGALRAGIRNWLKGSRYVKSMRYGDPGEGGDGVTVVELNI